MDCEQLKFDLAAEALAGRNQPGEEEFAPHLVQCEGCRREYHELLDAARLLRSIDPNELAPKPVADPERVITALRESMSRPRSEDTSTAGEVEPGTRSIAGLQFGLVASFAMGLLMGSRPPVPSGRHWQGDRREVPTTPVGVLTGMELATGVEAVVGLFGKGWGTEVSLSLTGLEGPLRCSLVAVSSLGQRHVVSQWAVPESEYAVSGSPDRIELTGSSALAHNEITSLEVETWEGRRLVKVTR
ncbi:anti-sigma factor [Streptomyces zaomyceticus]|uniref:hypothetical protein n=1 Tax=Streptomyces zaomyceticus TaxID=68286 RepID=UPI00367C7A81